ncbi:MAG TPA: S-layer homology domain-containing protein [Coleofasciculaceae cyanobacterium]|jgi:hypothetical protein
MFNRVVKLLPIGAIVSGVVLSDGDRAQATPQNIYQDDLGQVTNVNQLRDVAPTDWAYEALRSLVDRYGCIAGFPNQTYRSNQPLTRYEFAAELATLGGRVDELESRTAVLEDSSFSTTTKLNTEIVN